ncbi:MAG: pyridoxine 5'-phosphate synthase [Candidatus Marinimicrobia bacterium]|nr:pyridoxine 5'-phosphate synthase [Candidatus Neomarinimicrobiota bacterium]
MPYLEVNLDSFISVESIVQTPLANPLNLLTYIESCGVMGISFTFQPELPFLKNISLVREMTGARLNIRSSVEASSVEGSLFLKPDVLTLIDWADPDRAICLPSKPIRDMLDAVSEPREFAVALRIHPHPKQLKEAYTLNVDEIEIATDPLTHQTNRLGYLSELDAISRTVRLANKKSVNVTCSGNLDERTITAIRDVANVEFFSVGKHLLSRALADGFGNALKEMIEHIETR